MRSSLEKRAGKPHHKSCVSSCVSSKKVWKHHPTNHHSSSSPWSFPFFRTFQQHPRLNCPPHLSDIFIQRFDVRSMASLGQLQLCCRDVLPAVCVPQKHRKIGRTKTSGKGGTMHNIVDIINVKSETSLKQIFSKLVWIKQKCWSLCYSQLFPNQP